jgi:Active DUF488-N3 subclade
MIHIWTMQLSKWRLAKRDGILILNITAQSGLQCFAPEFENVRLYKQGALTQDQYTELYLEKMRRCYVQYRNEWNRLEGIEKMALTCYCKAGDYCHRHLFKGCLTKYFDAKKIEYEDHGELTA